MTAELTDILLTLCRRFGAFERDTICCGDVTTAQCAALQSLLKGPRDVSALASYLGTTVSASTRLVHGMERRGWIARRRDPTDGRRVLLHLSSEGQAEARRLRDLTETMIAQILAHIPEEEHDGVVTSLDHLCKAIEASNAQLPGRGCC